MLSLDDESKNIIINVINFLEIVDIKGSQNAYNLLMSINGLKNILDKDQKKSIEIDNTDKKKEEK